METSYITTVPQSIEASTKDELGKIMLAINLRTNSKVHFFDFTYANGKWHCWYEINMSAQDRIELTKEAD